MNPQTGQGTFGIESRPPALWPPAEASYQQLFETLPIGIYRTAPDGRVLFANNYLARLLGYPSPEALASQTPHIDDLHPNHPAGWLKQRLEREGAIWGLEAILTRRDGKQIWVRENARAVFRADGSVSHHEGTIEEITERKRAELALRESEARYRMLAEIASHYTYVYRVEPDGRFTCEWIGGNYFAITGYMPEEVDAQGGWLVLHHPDDLALGKERDDKIGRGESSVTEFRIRHRDGDWRWLHNVVQPIKDLLTGRVVRFYGAALDITERKRVEEELRAARDAAEAASRAKSEFLANVSHEIRTPLHGIFGTIQLLQETELSPAQLDYLNLARTSADALLAVINDLLDFARIEAGRLELERVDYSLRGLLGGLVKMLDVRAREKGLTLACRIGADVPDGLIGDPNRLRQIVLNLLDNGIKFTDQGEVVVTVQMQNADCRMQNESAACLLEFSVADTGIGIPPDQQERIFEAFTQAESSTSRQYGGTGLGLTIAARLVEVMGGRLSVVSQPGRGSTFAFTVSFGLVNEIADLGPAPALAAGPAPLRPLHILVAEDNDINQKLTRDVLQYLGHSVEVVGSGQEALAALERRAFDVIFMDVYMPDLDGFQATQAIRQREQATGGRVPIIALTAHAVEGYKQICLDAGMDDFVSKPFRIQEIEKVLARLVGK